MAERRSRRGLRVGLIVLAILVLAPIAALVLFAARFDPNAYKPQIAEAVKRATGRDLALNGPIQLKLALHPTIEARDVALANIEGGSRPQMATLDRLDAEIALLPLLRRRLEIDRLVLVRPDILLETTAEGRPNWLFGPSVPSQTLPQPAPANASKAPPPVIALQDVRIEDGVLAYRDGKTGRVTTLGVKRLGAKATSLDSPVNLSMEASYNGAPFTLDGDVGPLSRIQQPDTAAPWPVRLTLASGGARANVSGALSHPAQARGYVLKLDGAVPDLAALQAFYPRAQLPSLRDVTFAAQVSDSGGRVPDVSSLTLHAGTSDLSALVAGLTLAKLDIAASRMDQPVTASAEGSFAGAPLSMTAKLGAPAVLIAGGSQAGPFPVDVSAEAAGASFSAKGGIADPVHLSGADLAVAAHVPDLAALAPLARRDLPPLKDVGFKAQLGDAAGGLAHGVALHGAELTLPEGDLAGDLAVEFGARPLVRAGLTSKRVDFDALRTALMTRRGPTATTPAQPSAVPSTPPRPALPHAEPKSGWLIPDEPLPFDLLRTGDADVTLRLAVLTLGGVGYRDIAGHVVLQNGQLRLDPFAAGLPGGRMDSDARRGCLPGNSPGFGRHARAWAGLEVAAACDGPARRRFRQCGSGSRSARRRAHAARDRGRGGRSSWPSPGERPDRQPADRGDARPDSASSETAGTRIRRGP